MKNNNNIPFCILLIALVTTVFVGCESGSDSETNGGVSSAVFNSTLTYGTMTDQDGNTYKTIEIGNQTWMAENLRATKYRNGDEIQEVTESNAWGELTTGAQCSYENTSNNDTIATFGRLYNWYAVADSRNLAPTGWHIPTDDEWEVLITYLGGYLVAGGKMKESGNTSWNSPNTDATNESGFTALPAGSRYNGESTFGDFNLYGYFWSSTQYDETRARNRYLSYRFAISYREFYNKQHGFSVRCVKD